MGRLTERADHVARVFDVHVTLALDRPRSPSPMFWQTLLAQLGCAGEDVRYLPGAVSVAVTGPGERSIQGAIQTARRLAQAVRPSLSTEVFESLNRLHWEVAEASAGSDLHDFLVDVQRGVQLAWGQVDDTMIHDEAWDFLRLGKFLERAANVTRLVTGQLRDAGEPGGDPLEWAAVLRSCAAFEPYRWRYSNAVTPARVAGLLLLDRGLPRAVSHCVDQALASMRRIEPDAPQTLPVRVVGRLASLVEYASEDEVVADPTGFAAAFFDLLSALEEAVNQTYFRPSRLSAAAPAPPPSWAQPQQ